MYQLNLKLCGAFAALVGAILLAPPAQAETGATATVRALSAQALSHNALQNVSVKKKYALGVRRFDLDAHTEILGWQINNSWYFGRQDGLDSGLTLVWQQQANQISVSKDGLRLTRRF